MCLVHCTSKKIIPAICYEQLRSYILTYIFLTEKIMQTHSDLNICLKSLSNP